ncbi:MAG: MotA/TolQ/ExbB proton channel family protein [Lentisphaerota bacterium]
MLFMQMMKDGGPVMWIILGCSLIAVYYFLEKWFQFHREQINVKELVKGLVNVLKRDGFIEAISLCDNTPGPVARVLAAAILAYERGDDDLRQAIEDANMEEIPKLERHVNLLATIGYIAPLLGLLGTVLGMMRAFQTIHAKSVYLSAADLSGDINMALITTAAGLCVAIPCYIAYNYLTSRIHSICQEMERAASEINYFFKHHKSNRKPQVENE